MAKRFLTWLLLFIGITLVVQSFRPDDVQVNEELDDFVLVMSDGKYKRGEDVLVKVRNNLDRTVRISSNCPAEPLEVSRYKNGIWEDIHVQEGLYVSCEEVPYAETVFYVQPDYFDFPAKSEYEIDYSPWKQGLFNEIGRYRLTLSLDLDGVNKEYMTEFEVAERGFFSSVMYNALFRPIFNFMLFLTHVLPGASFGLAIIVLTLLIRLVLLAPNQKALKSQRSMMKIQPELEAIKKKYAGDQQKISQETMALWKRHKVNPVGGCLPILIQIPILIALFYVVKAGFSPYQSYMVYDVFSNIDLAKVNSNFYGILDLDQVNATWLPVLVGLLQFIQMKLSFSFKKKRRGADGNDIIEVDEKKQDGKEEHNGATNPMQMMNKMMVYFMPVILAMMTASLPSGVGLYLVVSTLFGVVQQFYVNRE